GVKDITEQRLQFLQLPGRQGLQIGRQVGLAAGEHDGHGAVSRFDGAGLAGLQRNPCRRSFDDGMRSSSRYLAMVRRAMRSPSRPRICTMAASDSGCPASSSATAFLIFSLTVRDETSAPLSLTSPEWKKNRISKSPRGVCMYLWFTTRLTVDSCMPMSSATSRRMRGRMCSKP